MSDRSNTINDVPDADGDVNDQPPRAPTFPSTLTYGREYSNVKKIAGELERGRRSIRDAEPARPKRDLGEEYTGPWKGQKQEEELPERVKGWYLQPMSPYG